MDWVLEDMRDRISDSQFGGLAGMSPVTALLLYCISGIKQWKLRKELLELLSWILEKLLPLLTTTSY